MKEFWFFLIGIVSYIVGSLPTGYLIVKFKKGIDIRKFGSGATGGTNTARILGLKYGILVGLIDVVKCFLLVLFFSNFVKSDWIVVIIVLMVTIGHIFPCFIGFKGGKGVSTIVGGLILLMGWTWLPLIAIWAATLRVTRKMSLTNLTVVLLLPLFLWLSKHSPIYVAFGFMVIIVVYYSHRENIKRLFLGKEPNVF